MKKRRLFIRIMGIFFLLVGLGSLFAFPAEFTSFYAFSYGGAFAYEGFGFGSLLFAVILTSALIYAVLALICIPLGIGNIRTTYTGWKLTRILSIFVIAIGVSSVVCLGASYRLFDSIGVMPYIVILSTFVLILIVLPVLLLRFYKNQETKEIFKPSQNTHFENQSDPKMAVVFLNLVWIMTFAVLIFLKGAFPFMGRVLFMTQGTWLLSIAMFVLFVLTYLFYRYGKWTRYVMLAFYAFLVLSVIISFSILSVGDFIDMLELPAYEMNEMAPMLKIVSEIRAGWFFGSLLVIKTVLLLTDKKSNAVGSDEK